MSNPYGNPYGHPGGGYPPMMPQQGYPQNSMAYNNLPTHQQQPPNPGKQKSDSSNFLKDFGFFFILEKLRTYFSKLYGKIVVISSGSAE